MLSTKIIIVLALLSSVPSAAGNYAQDSAPAGQDATRPATLSQDAAALLSDDPSTYFAARDRVLMTDESTRKALVVELEETIATQLFRLGCGSHRIHAE